MKIHHCDEKDSCRKILHYDENSSHSVKNQNFPEGKLNYYENILF